MSRTLLAPLYRLFSPPLTRESFLCPYPKKTHKNQPTSPSPGATTVCVVPPDPLSELPPCAAAPLPSRLDRPRPEPVRLYVAIRRKRPSLLSAALWVHDLHCQQKTQLLHDERVTTRESSCGVALAHSLHPMELSAADSPHILLPLSFQKGVHTPKHINVVSVSIPLAPCFACHPRTSLMLSCNVFRVGFFDIGPRRRGLQRPIPGYPR
jgi:hypothetical protein